MYRRFCKYRSQARRQRHFRGNARFPIRNLSPLKVVNAFSSCHGTIAMCTTDWPSFIHHSYFLPESVFRFVYHRDSFLSQAIRRFYEKKRVTILLGILTNSFAVAQLMVQSGKNAAQRSPCVEAANYYFY